METIHKETFQFLKSLAKNNNRDWFNSRKPIFLKAQENMHAFVDELIREMNKHDVLENETGKSSLYRIYKDVRFSKDKTPYSARFAFSLRRAGKLRRGGYYMNVNPGKTYLACGFFGPDPADLKRIRQDIDYNYKDWQKILNGKGIKTNFGILRGEEVLTAPRGYEKDHPAIGLLSKKQFILRHDFTDSEVLAPDFLKKANAIFKSVRPYFDYMSDVLTTDANGERLV